jgi:hypothetical protein
VFQPKRHFRLNVGSKVSKKFDKVVLSRVTRIDVEILKIFLKWTFVLKIYYSEQFFTFIKQIDKHFSGHFFGGWVGD